MTKISQARRAGNSRDETTSETIRRLRLGQTRRLLRWRYGATLPEGDDAALDDLEALLVFAMMHPTHGEEKTQAEAMLFAPWMDESEAKGMGEVIKVWLFSRKAAHKAVEAALAKLDVSAEERAGLKLWTLRPSDLTPEQFVEWQRERRRWRDKERRRLRQGRKPTITEREPWKALGVGRATWYRNHRHDDPAA